MVPGVSSNMLSKGYGVVCFSPCILIDWNESKVVNFLYQLIHSYLYVLFPKVEIAALWNAQIVLKT